MSIAQREHLVNAVMTGLRDRIHKAQADTLAALVDLGRDARIEEDVVFETCSQAIAMHLTDVLREIDDAPEISQN